MAAPPKEDTFDWKGDAGDKFAEWNPPSAEGADKTWKEFYGKTATDVLGAAVAAMEKAGMVARAQARALDIGCSSGGNLAVLEKMGFAPKNLSGVDLSAKAVDICRREHPEYAVQCVDGYDYEVGPGVDLVYHSGVLCQIPQDGYGNFFGKIKQLKPKFYVFVEGINPRGYEKIPNSVAHAHGEHEEDGGGGHCHHGGHDDGGHGGEEEEEEGFHHTNDMAAVVREQFPSAKLVHSERMEFAGEFAASFTAMHMEYALCNAYKL